ncbi:stage II sporulation protein M [Tumebacillus sp. BK434]|uniref:stage II sporulation protein M n=1 Tax=Tumebacillus sp. BK434 TaxID=2512169 RepID=UPI0010EDB787|nr:stage II sporulation protein M [Tumebacillus sp. BK434]TCP52252.1 stage II sporulation protein M [Tumebacillus sp. BK434]
MWNSIGTAGAVLKRNRGYILAASLLFVIGWVAGSLYSEQLMAAVRPMLEKIAKLAEHTQDKDSALYTAWVIFLNNLTACAVMVLFGCLLAVPTAISLVMNGLVIGVLFGQLDNGVSAWDLIVYGLLPHGIFELPAIVIAAAMGLKLGSVLLVPLRGKARLESFGFAWLEVVRLAWVPVVLLVVAAGVEATVTPYLLDKFVISQG